MTASDLACDAAKTHETRLLVKTLTKHCRNYKDANTRQAIFQLVTTLGAFFALCAVMIGGVLHSIYWPLLGIVPAGGLLVRLFIIQHDCGHGSFFPSRRANTITGRALSLLTWTPYGFWRRAHNMHHAGSGNLDKRGIGSIDTLTVAEYRALPWRRRLGYRLYRNPFIMLVLGTPLHVLLMQRFPHGKHSPFFPEYNGLSAAKAWKSIVALDLALVVFYGVFTALLGWEALALVVVPVVVIAAWTGGWLFFIQHQFEHAYWQAGNEWNFHEAAVLGSSYYHLPKVLQWFTGNIGLHHIHHLCAAVPNYRLQECLDGNKALQTLNRLTLRGSLQCLRWALWDEQRGKMVGFGDAKPAAAV